MAGHVRQGRRHLPPLAATGILDIADWVRDDLPDLLWPALVLAYRGTDAAREFVHWQAAVQHDLHADVEAKILAESLDGRLTSLDRLVGVSPGAEIRVRQRAVEFDLLPDSVASVLETYPERPAMWLVHGCIRPPSQDDIDLLAKALLGVIRDGHREAVIKCLGIWSSVQAGTFSSDAQTIALLKRYPNDPATRSRADSVVRASWGAAKGALLHADETRFDQSIKWAKVFWRINSMTTRCVRRRGTDGAAEDVATHGNTASAEVNDLPADGEHLQQLAMDLVASYVEALEIAPGRLYDPERQEVHAGLVSRVGREVITVLGCPDLWCIEYGSHVTRALIEARIYLQWMAMQEPTIYRQFQEYGAGKAKLYARILEEAPDEARIPGFDEAIEELERLSHNDDVIDHRVVDTGDSFAGRSIRAMAEECGLLNLYRHAYYISSGVTHSEWWSVETHAMEQCLNVLHRCHLIPSVVLSSGRNVPLATSWVDQLYALIWRSLDLLGTDGDAVTDAFSWLESEDTTTE